MWFSSRRKAKLAADDNQCKRRTTRVSEEFGPPISLEEQRANLSELEERLNREMKCHAGRNQVFIRSLLTGMGTTTPRITLKCHLRKDVDLKPDVFYEYIRDVCCGDPEQCPAYLDFKERFVET